MDHRPLSLSKGYAVTHAEEQGKTYTGHHQDIDPVIAHVRKVRDMHAYATKQSNPNGWKHLGSVPISIIVDWCKLNNTTFSDWARNVDGAKDRFLKYFMSRDFSKLHNQHVTTKRESSSIIVPPSYGGSKL